MKLITLTIFSTSILAITNAAPVPDSTDVQRSSGIINALVNTLNSLISSGEPVDAPGDHWKKVGKGYKKHWKKVGKGYKKKYGPPSDDKDLDDEDLEDEDLEDDYYELVLVNEDGEPIETPGDHWKKVGKGYKKHWKKVGKGYKKKYGPPSNDKDSDDDDLEDDYYELIFVNEDGEPIETPGDHWKKIGKGYKKHWKKIGKDKKKKYMPPSDDETEIEDEDEIIILFADDEETPGEHWKHYGKQQRKYWKKVGKDYKKKYTPPMDDEESQEYAEYDEFELI
jgi:hypothetical protein